MTLPILTFFQEYLIFIKPHEVNIINTLLQQNSLEALPIPSFQLFSFTSRLNQYKDWFSSFAQHKNIYLQLDSLLLYLINI